MTTVRLITIKVWPWVSFACIKNRLRLRKMRPTLKNFLGWIEHKNFIRRQSNILKCRFSPCGSRKNFIRLPLGQMQLIPLAKLNLLLRSDEKLLLGRIHLLQIFNFRLVKCHVDVCLPYRPSVDFLIWRILLDKATFRVQIKVPSFWAVTLGFEGLGFRVSPEENVLKHAYVSWSVHICAQHGVPFQTSLADVWEPPKLIPPVKLKLIFGRLLTVPDMVNRGQVGISALCSVCLGESLKQHTKKILFDCSYFVLMLMGSGVGIYEKLFSAEGWEVLAVFGPSWSQANYEIIV